MQRIKWQLLFWLKNRRYKRASEPGVSYIAEQASLYICRYDRSGRYVYVSPNLAEVLDQHPLDMVGQPATHKRFLHQRSDERQDALEHVLATGESTSLEITVPRPNGRTEIHLVRLIPDFDSRKRLTGVTGIGRDITEMKQAERLLRTQEQELRSLADSSPDNIIRYDRECRVTFTNRNLMQCVEIPAPPVIGLRTQDLSWGEAVEAEKQRYCAALERVIESGNAQTIEVLFRPTGSAQPRLHHIKMVAERDEDQQIKGALAFGRDITERKQMEELLAAREREFRSLAENLPDIVMRFDREGRRIYVNSAYQRFTGKHPALLLGTTVLEMPSFSDDPRVYHAQLLQSMETGKECIVESETVGKDGTRRVFQTRACPEFDADGNTIGMLAVSRDMTEIYEYRSKIHQLAYFDALTGLANRAQFNERIVEILQQAGQDGQRVGVLMMDLDRFKTINDTLGHLAGDQLLCEVAQRLLSSVRAEDTVARLGGDEFIVIAPHLRDAAEVRGIAERVLATVATPVQLDGRELVVQASIGIAMFPDHGDTAEQLVRYADGALYRAKDAGRNNVQFYTRDITDRAVERVQIEADLRRAIPRGELEVHYQPKVELATGRIVGAEALLRWRHPERGWTPPSDFIGIAEDTGLIVPLAEQVMRHACETACRWNAQGERARHIAINLSPRQFYLSDLPSVIQQVLSDTGCQPEWIELEITEGILLVNHAATLDTLNAFHRMGLRVAIDDFGTGYSALGYLTRFPISTLKIDRSFTHPAGESKKGQVLVNAIVAMAHGLGLDVVAEGVETRELADWLADIGCHKGQGYLWSKAVPGQTLLELDPSV
jgi:diguanylate cyclase (GGDEF)-like protein/PAS domain S-box-containing protein